ncbi:growth hormone secretagogue receptor type 1-like [Clavelina lepadiformis]|uniref:growth hormone secretagogue receptor type 1-like n=1 Tax=Clavelina lepadiformis TaxID=159417 RepID=UPI0040423CAC
MTSLDTVQVTSEPTLIATTGTYNKTSAMTYVFPFTDAWVIASTCILAVFFVFGLTANAITMAVIHTSPRLKNRYYTFLFSMCISDIVSAFDSILFLYRRTWGFLYFAWPEFFCRLYWGLDLWTTFATALHILSFAILRLIGVRWPTKFQRISSLHMKLWIGTIWTITFLIGFIPHFLFNTVKVIDRENDPSAARWASCSLSNYWFAIWQIYVQIAYAFMIYLPAAGILSISITIAVLLRKHRIPGETVHMKTTISSVTDATTSNAASTSWTPVKPAAKVVKANARMTAAERRWNKDKQAIYQLFLIVTSFLIGYVPLTAFHFYTGFTIDQSNAEINAFDWRFAIVQYIMLRFSECLNPIFYNLASKKMRSETFKMIKKAFRTSHTMETHRTSKGTSSGV